MPGIWASWRSRGCATEEAMGFRAAAGQAGGDLNGGEVNLRQRCDRQQGIGDQTDEKNAGHHQRGADGGSE